MARNVKEIVRIDAVSNLDALIKALGALRESLPKGAEPELLLRGCDVFGRHIAVSWLRPQTPEEEACDARHADAVREMLGRQDRERAAEASRGYGQLRKAA